MPLWLRREWSWWRRVLFHLSQVLFLYIISCLVCDVHDWIPSDHSFEAAIDTLCEIWHPSFDCVRCELIRSYMLRHCTMPWLASRGSHHIMSILYLAMFFLLIRQDGAILPQIISLWCYIHCVLCNTNVTYLTFRSRFGTLCDKYIYGYLCVCVIQFILHIFQQFKVPNFTT